MKMQKKRMGTAAGLKTNNKDGRIGGWLGSNGECNFSCTEALVRAQQTNRRTKSWSIRCVERTTFELTLPRVAYVVDKSVLLGWIDVSSIDRLMLADIPYSTGQNWHPHPPVSVRGREAESRRPRNAAGTSTTTTAAAAIRSRSRRRSRRRRCCGIERRDDSRRRSCCHGRRRGKDARPGEHACFLRSETEIGVAAPNSAAALLVGGRCCYDRRCRRRFGAGPGVTAFPFGCRRACRRGRHLLEQR